MRKKLLCIFLAISVALELTIHLVEIIDIYLESLLDNNEFSIYIKLLPGMNKLQQICWNLMYTLLKNLYSFKQLEQLWNQNIMTFFISLEFIRMNRDPSILIRYALDEEITMISVYIDNFSLTSNYLTIFNILKEVLGQKYSIKNLRKI